MPRITGRCFCGAIRFSFDQPPVAVRACWCRDCQYLSAGNASVNAVFKSDGLTCPISGRVLNSFSHARAAALRPSEAHAVEQRAHKLLARYRVRNEWFETTPAEAVAAVRSAAAPVAGKVTSAPDPAVIWPPTSQWRISPVPHAPRRSEQGLPLFEFSGPGPSVPDFGCDTPVEALGAYTLEVRCCGQVATFPLDRLASSLRHGGQTPLAVAMQRFRCERCGCLAREAVMASTGTASAWRLDLPPVDQVQQD